MKDWLKARYPKLDEPTLDRLTEIVGIVNTFGGKPKTPENYAILKRAADQLQEILGHKAARKLAQEMVTNVSRRGNA